MRKHRELPSPRSSHPLTHKTRVSSMRSDCFLPHPPRVLEKALEGIAPQPPTPLSVPVGLPGDLIRRRPDVLEAEAVLHVATAETGVAVASFYPGVSLSGQCGSE